MRDWAPKLRWDILLLLLGVGGLWILDVARLMEHYAPGVPLWNGLWQMDATQGFHLGLYMVVAALLGLALLARRD